MLDSWPHSVGSWAYKLSRLLTRCVWITRKRWIRSPRHRGRVVLISVQRASSERERNTGFTVRYNSTAFQMPFAFLRFFRFLILSREREHPPPSPPPHSRSLYPWIHARRYLSFSLFLPGAERKRELERLTHFGYPVFFVLFVLYIAVFYFASFILSNLIRYPSSFSTPTRRLFVSLKFLINIYTRS